MTVLAPAVVLALALSAPPGDAAAGKGATSTSTPASTPAPAPAPGAPPAASPAASPAAGPAGAREARGEDAPVATRRYQIEQIRISGLSRVRDDEVRRHLLTAEGELLDDERVLLSRLRLLQLGWFSKVETRVERGSERGLVVLVFQVLERNTLLVTDLVLGTTDPQPVYGGFGLSQQNFLGRGLGLSGAFVYGGSPAGRPEDPARLAVRASFFAPDVAVPGVKERLVFGATLLLLRGEEFACGDPDCEPFASDYGAAPVVRYERLAGEATVGVRPGPFERIHATFRYERVEATPSGPVPPSAEAGPPILSGRSYVSAITGTYELDTRDDFFLPRDGLRAVAQVTFGSRLIGGDYEYSRYLLNLETAFALLRAPLRFQAFLGAAQGEAPFFERFYGADFSYFAIGPALARALELNFSTDSRYDAFVAMAGLEYAVPLWSSSGFFRRGYLALGLRGVHSTATLGGQRTPFSRSPVSGEAALRLDTPVGAFNLSLGYAVDNFL
jgi:outer membrane protein assembly factor BamA